MRAIKFRAWDKCENRFVYFELFTGVNNMTPKIYQHAQLEEWKEFTGLVDKKGVEIYEGDICIVHDLEKETVEIIFRQETAGFEGFIHGIKTFKNPYVELSGQYYEVIGNIYQTPELLKPTEGN